MTESATQFETLNTSLRSTLWRRARLIVAVLLGWGLLQLLIGGLLLPAGVDRPLTVLIGADSVRIGAAGATAIVLLVIAWAGAWISGPRREGQALLVAGLSLALWASTGGTMDDWLAMVNVQPHGPSASPYGLLVPEYLYWGIVLVAAQLVASRLRRPAQADGGGASGQIAGLQFSRDGLAIGVQSLAITCLTAIVLLVILTGPTFGHTFRGQVYFAVGVAFFAGVVVARQAGRIDRLIWLLPAPLIVGLIGVVWAAMRPSLPGLYANVDIIPATGLARALPVEMLAVGLVAIIWSHRVGARLATERE